MIRTKMGTLETDLLRWRSASLARPFHLFDNGVPLENLRRDPLHRSIPNTSEKRVAAFFGSNLKHGVLWNKNTSLLGIKYVGLKQSGKLQLKR